ncbi:MAG: type VI secretion system contractile sheath large subunit [Acidobacteria bacterium]|nr:type VI secretion system contractile sheath large subunit [Acidobacteriota bacterium]MCI0721590.1 type VI secretion system contractile sheath large subunit [Acidobacteriota bacterium]
MSERFSFGKLDVHLAASSESLNRTPSSEVPFRIAVLGDFSGQTGREEPQKRPAKLHPVLIDRDNFEGVLQKLGVEAHLQLGASRQRVVLRFESLDDFHPDQIFARVSLFKRLRETRRQLNNPATFGEAAAEVRRWAAERQETRRPAHASKVQPETGQEENGLSAGFLLEDLKQREAMESGSAASSDWNGMLRDLVRSHLLPNEDPAQTQLVGYVDAAIGELMEAVLHHPEFQALEATWRGAYFLVSQLETGSELKVYLLDLTNEELASDLKSAEDLARTALYRVLVEETVQTPGADHWTLLSGNYVFNLESGDIESLGRLAKIASAAGAPFVAAASSSLVGCESLAATPHPDDWSLPGGTAMGQAWDGLRRLPEASSLGLILPRFLLRLPYGKKSDPIESFPFEELDAVPQHEHYLWGNPCFIAAYLLGRAFGESGWDFSEGMEHNAEGLPLHVYEDAGESVIKPCAETLLTERAAQAIRYQGIMPLLSLKGQDRIRLLRFQSLASPEAPLSGRWS